MSKVSIIVPVYNVEKYICRCVNSILGQTFQDFELILLDDGSPDRCPEICDRYAAQDARIKVLHLQNGGVSRATDWWTRYGCIADGYSSSKYYMVIPYPLQAFC